MKDKIIIILLAVLLIVPNSFAAGGDKAELKAQNFARLTATGETMYQGKPGETINVRFNLNNIGTADAYDINAIISPSSDGIVYPSFRTSEIVPRIIKGGSTQQVSFNLVIDESAESSLKTLPIKFEYTSGSDNATVNTVNFDIIVKINKTQSTQGNVFTTNVSFYPSNEIKPGENFIITYEIKNVGQTKLYDIKTDLTGLKENDVILTQGLSSQSIFSLAPGESQAVSYFLKVENNAKSGSRELKYDLKFNKDGSPQTEQSSIYFSVLKGASTASNIVIENLEYPKGTMGLNQTATVKFSIRNQGMGPANNVIIKAEPVDQGGLVSKTVSTHKLNTLLPGEVVNYEFQFFSTEGTATKNYPINISVSSMDDPMNEESKQETNQYIGIFVKGKDEGGQDDGPKSTPKLIIDRYEFDPQIVEAGSNFKMKLSFYNTNSKKAVKNIKIFLTSEPGAATGAQEASSSSVFTPVGSSNTFYIDSIPPKGKVEKELTMFTIPEALAKTHVITANLEYEDSQANPFTAKELIGVPVVQQAKLSVSELQYQESAFVGDEIPITVQFYNTGKVTLYNMMVKLEGDFNTRSGEYFVGNFQSGSSERFDGSIVGDEPGKVSGNLVFTYEDSTGQEQRLEKPININFEEMEVDPNIAYDEFGNPIEMGPDGMPIIPNEKKSIPIPLIIGGLIGLGVIVTIIIRKRKKKTEEEYLTIDEDEDLKIDE